MKHPRLMFCLISLLLVAGASSVVAQRRLAGDPPIRTQPQVETSGCPAEPARPLPLETVSPNDFVELQRTPCFGTCPVYTVQIRADGQVTWKGERSVRVTGDGSATVYPAAARALIEKSRDLWTLCNSYSASVSDAPTIITRAHIADQEKKVSDYFNTAPAWLRDLNYEIDSLVDTHRWVHGDPRTETAALVRVPGVTPNFTGFISRGPDADARGPKPGLTPLMQASARGDVSQIQSILSNNADPNAQDSSGWTALIYATQAQQPEAIKILLDANSNPNLRSHLGQTPLMAVVQSFYTPLDKVRLLIGHGADVNAQDNAGHTPLMFAMYGSMGEDATASRFLERAELVSALRESGARTDVRDDAGLTVFDYLNEEGRGHNKKSQVEMIRQVLLNPTPGARSRVDVSGHVTSGSRAWASTIELHRVGIGVPPVRRSLGPDGFFYFPEVLPGAYTVKLEPAPSFELPDLSVVVPNTDISNLEIAVPAVKEVAVRVAVEGGGPPPNFGLIVVATAGAAASTASPPIVSSNFNAVLPANIQTAVAAGAPSLRLIRLGTSAMVDDAAFRIAVPSPWSHQRLAVSNAFPDGSFRVTLPEGEYEVATVLPRLRRGPDDYLLVSLTSGSRNLLSERLTVSGTNPIEIRATFAATTLNPRVRLSGRVIGLAPGAESGFRVVLAGEMIGALSASINPGGSFEFPQVFQGRYIARVAPAGTETVTAARRRSADERQINVADKDVTGIEIVVPR